MKKKRTMRIQVEWTDVVMKSVRINLANATGANAMKPAPAWRGNYNRVTRLARSAPRRMVQVFA